MQSVADTIAFYEKAFGLESGLMSPTNEYGELKTGNTKLAFAANSFAKALTSMPFEEASPSKAAPPFEVGLVTTDVERAFARAIAAGAISVKKPEEKPWAQIVGYVRDNNGFIVEVCSPISD